MFEPFDSQGKLKSFSHLFIIDLKLQDGSDELLQLSTTSSRGVVEVTVISAILFVVVASCFLIMLYKLMSYWFIEVLVVLFCIGGVEVRTFIL